MDMGLRENISYGLPLPLKWLKQKHMEKLKQNRIDISLRYSLIPIIGINESGKESILQAILAFDIGIWHYFKTDLCYHCQLSF
jgi:predicted ATP-dependent endonuclease of OLD family